MTKTSRSAATADSTANDELKSLLADAEKALAAAGDNASEEITSLRDRLRDAVSSGGTITKRAVELAKEKAHVADEFVHEKPYVALGIAAGLGLIAGVLVSGACNCRRS